ncbi:hypothetical protein [Chitiniphilus shinanonensis]|uniref:hypothetical protein n=1 Tax=Chitiniphilus shinanonensis TaxID=553088 RepID=UPI00306DFB14
MADLDVTEILFDPDFMDTGLVCKRGAQVIGDDGMAVNAISNTPFAGVVTSDRGDLLERIATGERVKGSITIHTVFPLSDGAAGQTADIVSWRGRDYTVTNVNDYQHFGAGFVCATCELIPLAG